MSDEGRLEEILNAAYTCFTHHGVRRTTMDDIAKAAGMSRPAVYQYVRSKDDAYRRLGARLLDNSLTRARTAASADGALADRLVGILDAKLEMTMGLWQDSPAHAAELLGPDARLIAGPIGDYDIAMLDLLATTVAAARPRADAKELAELLLAFTRGLEADLSDPDIPRRRLRHGVALFIAGVDHSRPDPEESS